MQATIHVLHTHADFVIAAKPAGISIHCDDNQTGFVAMLSEQLKLKLYVVHRLDKVTSGVMVFARSAQAAASFGRLFEQREVGKFYLAISHQKPKKKQGTIKGDMQKSRRSSWKLLKTQLQPAVTQFISCSLMPGVRLFLVKPKTGKTHQIRVALKSISAPIVGDAIYANEQEVEGQAIDRCYLHAWQLMFEYQGEKFSFEQRPSEGRYFLQSEFSDSLEAWENPQQFFKSS
jgi:tRNA pseudouridine32 synthase/23S rRNA pseudouridine746 synthase